MLVGVLATLSVIVSTKGLGKTQFLGAAITFVRAAGFVEQAVDPGHVQKDPYFLKEKVKIDRQFMMIVGIFILVFMFFEKKGL